MFLSAKQGFGNSTPLRLVEESNADEELTLFNQFSFLPPPFHFPSFVLDICLPFFCASECCQAWR